jgi:hypothetical protein
MNRRTPPFQFPISAARKSLFRGKAGLLVFVITFTVWAPTIWNDFVEWDDLNMIVHNPQFNPPTWAGTGWYWIHPAWNLYQPLTTTLWAALAKIGWFDLPDRFSGHMNPAIFHLASILLHSGAALLLFGIFCRALRDESAAFIGAMVFALHPLQVEPIAFAGAMNNPLAGFLGLLAISRYLRATDPQGSQEGRLKDWTVGSIALLLATLAKPSAVVVPPMAFALAWAIHRRPLAKSFRSIIPWAFLVVPCIIWTKLIQHGFAPSQAPLQHRALVVDDAFVFYLRKLVWPTHLGVDYGHTPQMVISQGFSWSLLIVPLVLILTAVLMTRRMPLLTAAIACFVVGLLPNSGLVPFDSQFVSTVSDRYAYFAMTGPALAVAIIAAKYTRLKYALIAGLFALTILTERQISTWKNGEALFRHALTVNPRSGLADTNLAVAISDRSPEEAIDLCHRAIVLQPNVPSAWNTLGSLLMGEGQRRPAIEAFRQAHQLAPGNPIFASNYERAIKSSQK